MGGEEAIKKLMEIDPNVKAIVSSGYSSDSIMADFSQYGFKGVVARPYNVQQLPETRQGGPGRRSDLPDEQKPQAKKATFTANDPDCCNSTTNNQCPTSTCIPARPFCLTRIFVSFYSFLPRQMLQRIETRTDEGPSGIRQCSCCGF